MTRPKNPDAAEKEARLQEVNGEHTYHSAAIALDVPIPYSCQQLAQISEKYIDQDTGGNYIDSWEYKVQS